MITEEELIALHRNKHNHTPETIKKVDVLLMSCILYPMLKVNLDLSALINIIYD